MFSLNDVEAEALANKAGFSLRTTLDFHLYLQALIEKHSKQSEKFYKSAQISERMYYYIKNGVMPSKETLIAILITLGFDVEEIQDILTKGGYRLSESLPNDMIILWMLKNWAFDKNTNRLQRINEVLYDLELPLLMTRTKNLKSQD